MGLRRYLTVAALLGLLTACDTASNDPDAAASAASASSAPADASAARAGGAPAPDDAVMRKWSRSCALCHVDGNGGAPRVGNAAEWQPRLTKGRDVLLQHTLEGFNNMPPLGYCMSCERGDFVALIDFMSGGHR